MTMIEKVSREELAAIVAEPNDDINAAQRDEMAIPSYLHANPLIRWLMWKRYEVVHELAEVGPEDRVFEFGCGPGMFLPQLSKVANRVFATDLFPQFAKALSKAKNLNVEFVPDTNALEDKSIDVIVAADVLEHITDLNSYLELFQRKLKPGGRFVVSGPTESPVYKLGRIAAGFAGKGDYHHTNIGNLVREISAFGFRPQRHRNLPFGVPPHLFNITLFTESSGNA